MTDSTLTQQAIAEHLDMSERNARDVLKGLDLDWKTCTLEQIRVAYIRDLREKAAGRGGDDNLNLAKQRAKESEVKTAMMKLEYNQKIGVLVSAEDAAMAISEWCSSANREYRTGINKLISEIQSVFTLEIAAELVDKIVNPTIERIQDHAAGISRNLVDRGEGVHTTEETEHSGVDQQ